MRWLALLAWGWCSLGLSAEAMRYCDYPVYPPVSWSDGQAVRGLAPQVVKRVLEELGYEMQVVVLGNWKRCLMDAASGRVDLVLAYRTEERQQHLAFAEAPVLREEVALFYNRHKPLAVKSLADLAGYRGGLLFGESYGTEFDRFVTRQGRIEYVSDSRQNFGKLIRQRIDFIPYERRTGRLFVAGMPGGEAIVDAPEPLAVDYLRLAVSRRSPLLARLDDIDRILLALQADGSLQRWLEESERDYRTQGRPLEGTSKNVGEAVSARQKQAKKRSLRTVNEHFEPVFNAAMATQVVFRDALEAP